MDFWLIKFLMGVALFCMGAGGLFIGYYHGTDCDSARDIIWIVGLACVAASGIAIGMLHCELRVPDDE